MLRTVLVLFSVVGMASSAYAQDFSDVYDARQLSLIISTADICGYELDVDRASSMAKDMILNGSDLAKAEFAMPSNIRKSTIEAMDPTERQITCASQEKLALEYGILVE